MKTFSAAQQKALKTVHLIAVSLWLSNVISLLFLPIISKDLSSGDELYMYNAIYHFIDMFLLTPSAILTLITGLIYSTFTKWGFFKHGWLIYKWVVTIFIIVTGTFYLGPMVTTLLEIADLKRIDALQDQYYLHGENIGIYAAIINSFLLSIAVLVSVYKPWKNITKQAKNKNT